MKPKPRPHARTLMPSADELTRALHLAAADWNHVSDEDAEWLSEFTCGERMVGVLALALVALGERPPRMPMRRYRSSRPLASS